MDKHFFNVLILGVSFLLLFTAFQTGSMIQKTVVNSINKDFEKDWNGFQWDAYISLGVLYAAFSLSNWIAPSTVAVLGPKTSMIVAGSTYCLFIAQFLYPVKFGLMVASVIVGVGAAVIWTAQGNFLTINSNQETIGRNSGLFWALFQGSQLFGNIFVAFQFKDAEHIDKSTRTTTYLVLTVAGAAGLCLMFTLRKVDRTETHEKSSSPLQALQHAFKLIQTKKMLLLCLTFFYTGIAQTFYSGVYSNAVGFTRALGADRKQYVGISGMLIGVGEILGGAVFGIFGKRTVKFGRDPIVFLGFLLNIAAFGIIYFNLPASSAIADTDDPAIITPSIALALICSFLLGLGDSCYNTQIYSLIGSVYEADSSPAFAIFKFIQSLASSAGFFYSSAVGLDVHVWLLASTSVLGCVAFFLVERDARIQDKKGENDTPTEVSPASSKEDVIKPEDINQSQVTLVVD